MCKDHQDVYGVKENIYSHLYYTKLLKECKFKCRRNALTPTQREGVQYLQDLFSRKLVKSSILTNLFFEKRTLKCKLKKSNLFTWFEWKF